MGTSISYTLVTSTTGGGAGAPTASGAGTIPCPIEPLSQQAFLDLFDRLLPLEYLDGMKTGVGPGYELYRAFAKLFERISLAVERYACGGLISTAPGGSRATVTVAFTRATSAAGAVTVKAGTVVTTSKGGRDFVTIQDAVFGGADLGPIAVPALAVAPGYDYNVKGQVTLPDGSIIPGEIDTLKSVILEPPFGDATMTVANAADAAGGSSDLLDATGRDRGVFRHPAEQDSPYRQRVRQLPDTITLAALRRIVRATFDPFGLEAKIIETFQLDYQTCWDGPEDDVPGTTPLGSYDAALCTFDDPRSSADLNFNDRWLDEGDHRGGYIVVVPRVPAIAEHGMVADDPAETAAARVSPATGGRRVPSAADVPSTADPANVLAAPAADGYDAQVRGLYLGLWDLLKAAAAAGVTAAMELDGQ